MSTSVHIVCFDAPSPPDYGGAIDLFYKVIALAKIGIKIKLHYFSYNEDRNAKGLEKYCITINAYTRDTGPGGISAFKPYIVSSRINRELIKNLNADKDPVILEGIHCTGILPYLKKGRKILVRVHNDEAIYYRQLARSETSFFKKIYDTVESWLLYDYQKELPHTCTYTCLSETDEKIFKTKYHLPDVYTIPSFIPWQTLNSIEGKGDYCLYHGNLSIAENNQVVVWLIKNIYSKEKIPFVIAGKHVPGWINKLTAPYAHIKVYNNPTNDHLALLIKNAHVNLLPSFNNTGVKLKLLHALFEGRFCLTNSKGVQGSGISAGIYIADEPEKILTTIKELFTKPFTQKEIQEREFLNVMYNNEKNALQLSVLL